MSKREAKTFSSFIREASSREKKKVYTEALTVATKAQVQIMDSARAKASA